MCRKLRKPGELVEREALREERRLSTEVALGLTRVPPLGPTEKYHHRDLRWGVPLLGLDSKNIIIGGGGYEALRRTVGVTDSTKRSGEFAPSGYVHRCKVRA